MSFPCPSRSLSSLPQLSPSNLRDWHVWAISVSLSACLFTLKSVISSFIFLVSFYWVAFVLSPNVEAPFKAAISPSSGQPLPGLAKLNCSIPGILHCPLRCPLSTARSYISNLSMKPSEQSYYESEILTEIAKRERSLNRSGAMALGACHALNLCSSEHLWYGFHVCTRNELWLGEEVLDWSLGVR